MLELCKTITLAEFKNGLNYSQENFGKGVKIISVADFKNYDIPKYSTLSELDQSALTSDDYLLKENDFIFVRSNGNRNLIGRTLCIKNIGNRKVTFSGFSIRCRLNSEKVVKVSFLKHILKSGLIRRAISEDGSGTNISNLNQGILSDLNVVVPSLEEQEKISIVLNELLSSEKFKNNKLEKYKELKKGLMQDLLTGKVRVK